MPNVGHEKAIVAGVFALLAIASVAEVWILHRRGTRGVSWPETSASIMLFVGHELVGAVALGITLIFSGWVWDHRAFTLPITSWSVLAALLGVDLLYYWHHRLSHHVNWLWATHSVHHSTEHFNLTAAYRLGWTPLIDGLRLFFLPLVFLGFEPKLVLVLFTFENAFQVVLHSTLVPRLGWLDRIFNTPSNHRVHHARNAEYIDRNFGGILMVFDRLFGTYAAERGDLPCEYGLTKPIESRNPLRIVSDGWVKIAVGLRKASGWRERLVIAFGYPV